MALSPPDDHRRTEQFGGAATPRTRGVIKRGYAFVRAQTEPDVVRGAHLARRTRSDDVGVRDRLDADLRRNLRSDSPAWHESRIAHHEHRESHPVTKRAIQSWQPALAKAMPVTPEGR